MFMIKDTIAAILGGGKGERLYPLTKDRAKPAVPIAGKFRLVDIPISNCIDSGVDRIFVLTQFNSTSLNRHIVRTYRFDVFSRGYVQILAAQQTQASMDWYQDTGDAVRQNLRRFEDTQCKYILVLAGDHLYRMDYGEMIQEHVEKEADITVAVLPVTRDRVKQLGILRSEPDGRITDFREKPQEEREIDEFRIDEVTFQQRGIQSKGRSHVASMGIYLFNKDVLTDCLQDENMSDFGKHVIPASIGARKVYAHFFDGYWRDVGTIKSFYEANLELTHLVPEFDFYDESTPVYTRPRFLPGSKVNGCFIQSSILSDGSIITGCEIQNSVIGIRSIVRSGAKILNSVVMGGDHYESLEEQRSNSEKGIPPIGIGEGSLVQNAILDHNVRIGRNVRIVNQNGMEDHDGPDFTIRNGITVIHKNAALPDDTVI
jgi:glucose-1-phosphate adenylyltransferase